MVLTGGKSHLESVTASFHGLAAKARGLKLAILDAPLCGKAWANGIAEKPLG
jgi:hypothetical protein